MLEPLFTIIIPVYNIEDYIKQCLDSIINQDFNNCEVIIINDGSTDNSGMICDEFSKKYDFIKVYNQENSGVSVARNKAIELANGDYIWFVDGDDYINDNALLKLDKALNKYKCPDVLGFSFNNMSSDNIIPFKKQEILQSVNGNEFLKYYTRLALWTFLYKRELLIKNNIKCIKDIAIYEDNLFNLEVFNKSNTIIQTNLHLYNYRNERTGSSMNNTNYERNLHSLLLICKRLNHLDLDILSDKTLNRFKFYFWEAFLKYFDASKTILPKAQIQKLSNQLYVHCSKLKPSFYLPIYANYDIIIYTIFKSRYLEIREFKLIQLFRKILVKCALILKNDK